MGDPEEATANKACIEKFTDDAIEAVSDYVHEALSG